jgi:hypothetical protein
MMRMSLKVCFFVVVVCDVHCVFLVDYLMFNGKLICVFGKREEFVMNAHISHCIKKFFPRVVYVRRQEEWLILMNKILLVVVQFPMVHGNGTVRASY